MASPHAANRRETLEYGDNVAKRGMEPRTNPNVQCKVLKFLARFMRLLLWFAPVRVIEASIEGFRLPDSLIFRPR